MTALTEHTVCNFPESRRLELMNATKPLSLVRTRGTTFAPPSPYPSPSGRGSCGFGADTMVGRGTLFPDCVTIPLSLRERARVRGNRAFPVNRRRTTSGTAALRASSGSTGGFPTGL